MVQGKIIIRIPQHMMVSYFNTCTVLRAVPIVIFAFFAIILEALLDGRVVLGLPRRNAQVMAA